MRVRPYDVVGDACKMMQRKRPLIMTVAATAQSIVPAAVLFGWHAIASCGSRLGSVLAAKNRSVIDTFIWSMTAKARFGGLLRLPGTESRLCAKRLADRRSGTTSAHNQRAMLGFVPPRSIKPDSNHRERGGPCGRKAEHLRPHQSLKIGVRHPDQLIMRPRIEGDLIVFRQGLIDVHRDTV